MPTPALPCPRTQAWVRGLVLAALGLAGLGADAGPPGDGQAARVARERADIQAERDRLEARFATELAACSGRFAVTACEDDVRDRRRAALEGPRARALALDDAERRSRAAARREAVAQKQRLASERPAPAGAEVAVPPASAPLPPTAAAPTRVPPEDAGAARAAAASAAETAAAQRVAAARTRRAAAQAEQARIAARQAERARRGKVAAPLPLPASAPRSRPSAAPGSAPR